MESTPTIAAARSFLALVQVDGPPSDKQLARALDALAVAYHEAPKGDPAEDGGTPSRSEYQERYAELSKRFPAYGYYAVSDPSEPISQDSLVGDAIDDLADIVGDLEEVIWRFENFGADDAHSHFRFLFEVHWGEHLRELSHYLHVKIWRPKAVGANLDE